MPIKAVVFDVGETLVDEARDWGEWADFLGVTRFTFFAALGSVIAAGQHHRKVFDIFRPGVDFSTLREMKSAMSGPFHVRADDLYPDALPCLKALKSMGVRVGIAGNQPIGIESALRFLNLPVDFVASSEGWGIEKPSPAFFGKVAESCSPALPAEIAYVGDHFENDIIASARFGLVSIFIRRGPWAMIRGSHQAAGVTFQTVSSLHEIAPLVAAWR